MDLIIDFLLLAASGAACLYCFILNKRLRALTNTKNGIATGIASLSQSVEEMQTAIATSKNSTGDQADRLEALLRGTEEKIPEVLALLDQINTISTQAVSQTETATISLVETLRPHIKEARDSATLLLSTLDRKTGIAAPDNENKASESQPDTGELPFKTDDDDSEFVDISENDFATATGAAA